VPFWKRKIGFVEGDNVLALAIERRYLHADARREAVRVTEVEVEELLGLDCEHRQAQRILVFPEQLVGVILARQIGVDAAERDEATAEDFVPQTFVPGDVCRTPECRRTA